MNFRESCLYQGGHFMKFLKRLLPFLVLSLYLGVYNGNLALMREGSDSPVQVYRYSVSMYPEADRQELERGIPIRNERHLAELLEAYLS